MIKEIMAQLAKFPLALPRTRISRMRAFLINFGRRKLNVAAMVFLAFVVLIALLADLLASDKPIACSLDGQFHFLPVLSDPAELRDLDNLELLEAIDQRGGWALLPPIPYGPNRTKNAGRVSWLESPNRNHLLGTDDAGRDVMARIIHGARTSMLVGMGSVALYLLVAILLGAVAGYFGGLADRVALRLIETFSSFPTFFLILTLQGLLGATSITQLVLVIGLTRWTDVARLTRAEVLRLVNEDYILAARALGLGHVRILARHVMPGAIGAILVAANFGVAGAILIESTLSFLGFGVPQTTPSWGQLLTDAFNTDGSYWLVMFPGLILFLTVISINLFGEGLRESLDRYNLVNPKRRAAKTAAR